MIQKGKNYNEQCCCAYEKKTSKWLGRIISDNLKLLYKYFREEGMRNNRCSELLLDQENAGCEDILVAARRIMADKKVIYLLTCLGASSKLNDKYTLSS